MVRIPAEADGIFVAFRVDVQNVQSRVSSLQGGELASGVRDGMSAQRDFLVNHNLVGPTLI